MLGLLMIKNIRKIKNIVNQLLVFHRHCNNNCGLKFLIFSFFLFFQNFDI